MFPVKGTFKSLIDLAVVVAKRSIIRNRNILTDELILIVCVIRLSPLSKKANQCNQILATTKARCSQLICRAMEFLKQEEREVDECGTGRKKESVLIRCMRKKYRCFIMFLCIITLAFQTMYLIVEKMDAINLNNIAGKLLNDGIFDNNSRDPGLHTTKTQSFAEYSD